MSNIREFNQERIDSVLKLSKVSTSLDSEGKGSKTAEITALAQCISLEVEDHKVCVKLPLGLGKQCIDVPDWIPNGEAARVCLSINFIGVLPRGVKICVYVANQEIVCKNFNL